MRKRACPLLASFILLLTACDQKFEPEALKLNETQAESVKTYEENNIPSKLLKWDLFHISNSYLKLHTDAIPYHLNTPLFSDYAHKFRSIWLPKGEKIKVLNSGELLFPTGSILSKTFYYPRENFKKNLLIAKQLDKAHNQGTTIDLAKHQLLETRLLVKQTTGWLALPYVWNKQQTEATLEVTGGAQPIELTGNKNQAFTYIIPDANQCKGCHVTNHTSGELKPIGPKLRHLNLDYQYSDALTENQLTYLEKLGKIDKVPTSYASNTNWHKRSEDIANAARSYIDINCAHCHNPDGPADTSALYLNRENLQKAHLGICKTPVAAGKGTGDRAYDITPGQADESIMLFRMESNDPSIAMPELGRAIVHEEGVALIRQWINELDGSCEIPRI